MPILHCDTIAVTEAEAMKILLAEDDINLGKLLSMLLKKQKYNCELGAGWRGCLRCCVCRRL